MDSVVFEVSSAKGVKKVRKAVKEWGFGDAPCVLLVSRVKHFSGAPRMLVRMEALLEEYRGRIGVRIKPYPRIKAASDIATALSAAAVVIREVDGYVLGEPKLRALDNYGVAIRQSAGRLPRPEERRVLSVSNDLRREAGHALKMRRPRARRQKILKIAEKIEGLLSSAVELSRRD